MSARRIRYEVRFNRRDNRWCIYRNGTKVSWAKATKAVVVGTAAETCRHRLAHGQLSELFIKNKDGKIGKGSNGRRTYGKDPRGTKG